MREDILKIKECLKQRKITYPQLAEMSGVPLNTLKNIFGGFTPNPRIDTMQAIKTAIGLTDSEQTELSREETLENFNIEDFKRLTESEKQHVANMFNLLVEIFNDKNK